MGYPGHEPHERADALSCLHLNEMLQQTLNPGPILQGLPFRPADKVLQRKNEVVGNDFIVNGDLGQIVEIDDKADKITVAFTAPERIVKIDRRAHNLAMAYCITIHKMQGSESPVVIIPVHNSFGGFFTRELIYTAISRAREICLTVGQWSALEAAARRVGNDKRTTRLPEFLRIEA